MYQTKHDRMQNSDDMQQLKGELNVNYVLSSNDHIKGVKICDGYNFDKFAYIKEHFDKICVKMYRYRYRFWRRFGDGSKFGR